MRGYVASLLAHFRLSLVTGVVQTEMLWLFSRQAAVRRDQLEEARRIVSTERRTTLQHTSRLTSSEEEPVRLCTWERKRHAERTGFHMHRSIQGHGPSPMGGQKLERVALSGFVFHPPATQCVTAQHAVTRSERTEHMRDLLELPSSARTAEVMNRCVLFREYEVSWPQLYEAEKALVLGQIGEHLLAIEHIGSTSVPSLSAKPIIDMLLGIETLEKADVCLDPLDQLGYEYLPYRKAFTKARRFLRKYPLGGRVGYHLHLLQPSNPYWTVLLVFRNYLRHHPDTAHQYSLLKKQLAEQFATDPLAYLHGKADFIRAVLQVASGGDGLTTIQKFLPEHGQQYLCGFDT